MTVPDKRIVRRQMRGLLGAIAEREARSASLCAELAAQPEWQTARVVALFAPQPIEPDVDCLWEHRDDRTFCYPIVQGERLEFLRVEKVDELVLSPLGIREPAHEPARIIDPAEIELMLVPGLAFTPAGGRLGRGGGYYDRLLSLPSLRALRLGVCFEEQLLPELPLDPHDQPVHRVIAA